MAAQDAILIIDLGSTHVKSTIFSPTGEVLARAGDSYATVVPHPAWAEQEPAQWWKATVRATRNALQLAAGREGQDTPPAVSAIGVTGQMHGLVALDRRYHILGPCLTVQDRRAADDVPAIEAEAGEGRTYAITGARLDAASPAAKLRWLHRHHPALMAQATMFLPPKDYLRYRLTNEIATEPIDAAGTLLYNLSEGMWSEEMAQAARISTRKLPPIRAAHTWAGVLSPEAATALELTAGIPVAIGAGDDVECLGAGLMAPGRALEHLGTTGSILACSPQPVIDALMRVDCYPHAVPGLYLVGGSTSSAGSTLDWAARSLVTPGGKEGEEEGLTLRLDDLTLSDDEDLLIFLPYLAGERCPVWQADGRGVLAGMSLGTTTRQIVHAIFSGVAFSLRHILDTLLELGLRIDDLVASGDDGATSGAGWPLLRSTVYGRPLVLPGGGDPTAAGALILTLVAAGIHADVVAAAHSLALPAARRVEPTPNLEPQLERRYRRYRELSATLAPLFTHWKS